MKAIFAEVNAKRPEGLRHVSFSMYIPPLMEALGPAELTHDAKNNKMKAK